MADTRPEHDLLGTREVPSRAYWGIHTLRAQENFPLSGRAVNPRLIRAYALVKQAACRANHTLAYLDADIAGAIEQACVEIAAGSLADQFPVDSLQGGAGTSTNMNVNEVIANRGLEILGEPRGRYDRIHPLEQVNLHQSTNDTYPTALKIAAITATRQLSEQIAALQAAFQKKEKEFGAIVTVGRTELQPAVPLSLGGIFGGYAEAFSRDRWRLFKCEERLRVVNIGGTAVGTGLGAPREYIFQVIDELRVLAGMGLCRGENVLDATQNTDVFVEVSGMLTAHATTLIKTGNDLRLMHFLNEIALPMLQAGSSIMPGKVNPVLCEAAMQAGMRVIANGGLISDAVSRAGLQINEFLPLVAQAFLESFDLLLAIDAQLCGHVEKITANAAVCREHTAQSPAIITALLPQLGYERATELTKELRASGRKDVQKFLEERLGGEMIREMLSPGRLMSLGYARPGGRGPAQEATHAEHA